MGRWFFCGNRSEIKDIDYLVDTFLAGKSTFTAGDRLVMESETGFTYDVYYLRKAGGGMMRYSSRSMASLLQNGDQVFELKGADYASTAFKKNAGIHRRVALESLVRNVTDGGFWAGLVGETLIVEVICASLLGYLVAVGHIGIFVAVGVVVGLAFALGWGLACDLALDADVAGPYPWEDGYLTVSPGSG